MWGQIPKPGKTGQEAQGPWVWLDGIFHHILCPNLRQTCAPDCASQHGEVFLERFPQFLIVSLSPFLQHCRSESANIYLHAFSRHVGHGLNIWVAIQLFFTTLSDHCRLMLTHVQDYSSSVPPETSFATVKTERSD